MSDRLVINIFIIQNVPIFIVGTLSFFPLFIFYGLTIRKQKKKLFLQVRPVLKRADSVKLIGNAVLDSRVSAYAADRIEGAIDVADKYVEKYLPSEDQIDCEYIQIICEKKIEKEEKNFRINKLKCQFQSKSVQPFQFRMNFVFNQKISSHSNLLIIIRRDEFILFIVCSNIKNKIKEVSNSHKGYRKIFFFFYSDWYSVASQL